MDKLSKELKDHFRKLGGKGGSKRMSDLSAKERTELARKAGKASGRARRKRT